MLGYTAVQQLKDPRMHGVMADSKMGQENKN
jgi:hypothetical protein